MEAYFATLFEHVTHERSLTLLLSLTNPDILKQNNFTDHEKNNRKFTRTENKKTICCFIINRIIFFCLVNNGIYKFEN